jgi:hypothetical protein
MRQVSNHWTNEEKKELLKSISQWAERISSEKAFNQR